ncbi:hypothetical protein J8F10_11100 [Gemmata sp. G18]|uniref:Cytochrome c domain-containing protein n=1 Tax=Gemmata palustris TaxID=2822762 RepID=A0ABS5BQ55_9BACT|nr:hypothetical protein [Gemmata palustris]MBP3955831.1 hypothetical protein [Gemmata palustris]
MPRVVAGFVLTLVLLCPALARGAETPDYRVAGDLAIRARDILKRHCAECHTGSLEPGASKLKLTDHKQVTKKSPIPFASPNGRSLILELVKDGSMPPANRPGPDADEIAVLEKWVNAKAPAYPIDFDERTTLAAIADDFERASANAKAGEPGEYLRYVSFAHRIVDGKPLPDLVGADQRLREALNVVSGLSVGPEPIDSTATVFRIDTRKLGWHTRELFNKMEGFTVGTAVRFRPFDLILLEYPHARALAANDLLAPRLEKLLARESQVRPIPFVRDDWLTDALVGRNFLSRAVGRGPDPTPLAEDIRALAALEKAIAGKADEPDGPIARPFAGARAVRVSASVEGRAPIPPLSAWFAGDVAPVKAPFVLKAELVIDGKPVKQVKASEPFQLRVSCDRTVFFTLLLIQADGDVRVQTVQGGTVLKADTERLLTPNGKGFSISSILTGGDTGMEHFVLLASETELPLPTVLQSKHLEKPIRRFLFNPTAKEAFDPNAVVRKLIPIEVTSK